MRYACDVLRVMARTWLDAARGPSGAWGYVVGGEPGLEPTLLSVAAGLPLPVEWLTMQAPSWGTLMLPACLRGRTGAATALSKAAGATILSWEPWLAPETPGDFDGSLRGWSWTPGTFTWVEPTLWSILSLDALEMGEDPRVAEGLRVLADRQGSDGGWNAGNPSVLGEDLPSYAYLTGLVLLGLPRDHPCVGPAVTFLSSDALRPSTLSLSASILGLLRHGRDVEALVMALQERASGDGSFDGRVDRTALALLALQAAAGEPGPLLPAPGAAHDG